jgi:hypothetical protein
MAQSGRLGMPEFGQNQPPRRIRLPRAAIGLDEPQLSRRVLRVLSG